MDLVLYLEEKGFRKDLVDNAIVVLKQDLSSLLTLSISGIIRK